MDKRFFTLLLIIPFLLVLSQVRDSDIKNNFTNSLKEIKTKILQSESQKEFDLLQIEIKNLQKEFSAHRKFLNKALYPMTVKSSFKNTFTFLKENMDKKNLTTTLAYSEQENDSLKGEISNITENFQHLSNENNNLIGKIKSLKITIKRDKKTIKALSNLIDKLKINIKNRDDLVVVMLDSLFDEFQKPQMSELSRNKVLNSNIFETIKHVVDDNIKFVVSSELTPNDYIFIKSEQQRFSSTWKKVAPLVIKTYMEENQRITILSDIDAKIHDWEEKSSKSIFKKLYLIVQKNNFGIAEFQNGNEFHKNIINFIDNQIAKPNPEIYEQFVTQFWTAKFNDSWIQLLLVDDLKTSQYQAIQNKIAKWKELSSNDNMIYIIIGATLLFLIIILILIVSKGKKKDLYEELDLSDNSTDSKNILNPNYKGKK